MTKEIDLSKLSRSDIIDSHTHSGFDGMNFFRGRFPATQNTKDLVDKVTGAGVRFLIVSPMATSTYYNLRILAENLELSPSGQQDFPYQRENAFLLYECRLLGGKRVLPFLAINPLEKVDEQVEQLEEWIKSEEIYGLKLHTLATHSPATALEGTPFLDLARKYNLPIMIHSGIHEYAKPSNVFQIARRNRDIRFSLCHFGDFLEELFVELENKGNPQNLFIDTSPFISLCRMSADEKLPSVRQLNFAQPKKLFSELVQKYSDILIWGTDEPWTIPLDRSGNILQEVDYKDEVDLLLTLPQHLRIKLAQKNIIEFLEGNRH